MNFIYQKSEYDHAQDANSGNKHHRILGSGNGGCKGFDNKIGCGIGDGSGYGYCLDEGPGITFGPGSGCHSKTGSGTGPGYGRGNGVMT